MKISDYVESQIKGLWGTDFDENGIPVIKTNNLTYEGHIDYSDICKRNITEEQAKEWYLRPGDLLIEKSGGTKTHSVGYVSYFEGEEDKYVCNNFILALRPKNSINSKFLFYQIQFKYESNQFSDCFNKTTGIQNLKVKDYLVKEIKIYTPEEQEKIVSELDTVRSIINKNKQILEKYEILIKSRFIEMFGDPVANSKGWNLQKLESLGKWESGGTPSRKNADYFKGNIPWYSAGELNTLYLEDSIEKITEEAIKESSAKLFKKGSLFVGMYDTAAFKMGIAKEDCSSNQACANINPNSDTNVLWLYYELSEMKEFFLQNRRGVRQKNLNLGMIKGFEIPVPPLELQQQFASFVQQIDKSKFEIWRYLKFCDIMKRIGFILYD